MIKSCIHIAQYRYMYVNLLVFSFLLVVFQVAEYNKLKTKAGKKAAALNQQLERVRVERSASLQCVYMYMYIHMYMLHYSCLPWELPTNI